jgi:PAS domain S-box-containing protein
MIWRRILPRMALVCGGAVAVVGGLVVLGWGLDVIIVPSANPASPAVRFNTGVAFTLAGTALALAVARPGLWFTRVLGTAVVLIGTLTLIEYVFSVDLGIDQLVFDNHSISVGRMAPNTATGFVLCGGALAAFGYRRRGWQVCELLALACAVIGWLGVIGYGGHLPELLRVGGFLKIALPTAVCFVLLGVGVTVAAPGGRVRGLVESEGAAGRLVRRELLAAVLFPPLIALLLRAGRSAGAFDVGTTILLLVGSLAVMLLAIALTFARSLEVTESERALSDRQLRAAYRRFRDLPEAAPDPVVIVEETGEIALVNDAAERLFGHSRDELVGSSVESLVPERFRAAHRGHRDRFFAAPATRPMGIGLELFALCKGGREVPVEISLSPNPKDTGLSHLPSVTSPSASAQSRRSGTATT